MRRLCRALAVVTLLAVGGPASTAAAEGGGPVAFADPAPQVVEGSSLVRIVVNRVDLPVSRLVVDYTTEAATAEAGSDFVDARGSLIFEVGARTATFAVEVRDDAVVEQTEHLVLRLVAQQTSTTARLTIVDDDRPPSTASASGPSGASTGGAAVGGGSGLPASSGGGSAATNAAPRPSQVQAGRRVTVATPARRKVLVRQNPVTPFELRPAAPSPSSLPPAEPTLVDPVLALAAGLLLARVAAEVWFRAREAAAA